MSKVNRMNEGLKGLSPQESAELFEKLTAIELRDERTGFSKDELRAARQAVAQYPSLKKVSITAKTIDAFVGKLGRSAQRGLLFFPFPLLDSISPIHMSGIEFGHFRARPTFNQSEPPRTDGVVNEHLDKAFTTEFPLVFTPGRKWEF